MGSRGPVKTPTRIRLLHGETRPSQLNQHEPKPEGAPRIPPGTSPEARRVWRRIIRDYGATDVITAADSDILRAYCDAVVRYEKAGKILDASGPLIRGRGGEHVKNPLHQVVRDQAVLIRSLARELGLTPSARTGINAGKKPSADPLDSFLEGAG